MTITIEKQGRRHYIRNTPFSMRDALRDAGCKWDPAEKSWWTSKADVAERFVGSTGATGSTGGTGSSGGTGSGREAPGEDATVAGRATYRGKTYYVAGRVDRGRTHWDDTVSAVTTRDGSRVLLYFRDGSSSFWAPLAQISGSRISVNGPLPTSSGAQIVKSYRKPTTIGKLKDFAAKAKAHGGAENYLEARAEHSGRCRGCGGPLTSARHHAAMGGYCGSCAFDEYDC